MERTPENIAIFAQLEKMIESRTFEKSGRARDLLRYIVEQELAGSGDAIKGFSIAVDVFGKDASFDPATDPLVRVHAGRLRELITAYYEGEGRADRVGITVPVGGYRPEISVLKVSPSDEGSIAEGRQFSEKEVKTKANDAGDVADQPNPSRLDGMKQTGTDARLPSAHVKRQIRYIWIAISLVAAMVLAAAGSYFYYLSDAKRFISNEDVLQDDVAARSFLPIMNVIADMSDPELKSFGEKLVTALSQYDTITTLKLRPIEVLQRKATNWTKLDYAIILTKTGSKSEDGAPIIKTELSALKASSILRAEEYPANIWDKPEVLRLTASKLTNVSSPEGIIYTDLMNSGELNPVVDCLLKVRVYYQLSNADTHSEAYECSGDLASEGSGKGLLRAIHGGLIAEAAGKGFEYEEIPEKLNEAFSFALATALKGVDEAPVSARSAREVGFVYSWQGAFSPMAQWFQRAYALNPSDTSIAASHGYGLVLSGEYQKAAQILGAAVDATTRHPTWWDFYHSLALMMDDRIVEAQKAIEPMGSSNRTMLGLILSTVLAHRSGDNIRANSLVDELKERYPKFAADPQGNFEKRQFPRELIDQLVDGLRKSGL